MAGNASKSFLLRWWHIQLHWYCGKAPAHATDYLRTTAFSAKLDEAALHCEFEQITEKLFELVRRLQPAFWEHSSYWNRYSLISWHFV